MVHPLSSPCRGYTDDRILSKIKWCYGVSASPWECSTLQHASGTLAKKSGILNIYSALMFRLQKERKKVVLIGNVFGHFTSSFLYKAIEKLNCSVSYL